MKIKVNWGVGFIIFGLLLVSFIDWVVEQEDKEVDDGIKKASGISIAKLFYAGPFILIGLAIILFSGREDKIEKIREDV
ncbi:MAG: hypothetical protein ABH851_03495 [Methanobacteriota archaeon]